MLWVLKTSQNYTPHQSAFNEAVEPSWGISLPEKPLRLHAKTTAFALFSAPTYEADIF